MDLGYEMEADWILLTTCNFRCNYCGIAPSDLGAKMIVYGTPAQWVEGFNATGKTWLLHITGGEPAIYPGFVSLCEQLARGHYLSINSNLSHQCVNAFTERIDPERVHYINAAVHCDERQKKASLDVFIERVHKLQWHHFNVLLSLVMTPRMMSIFKELSDYFKSHGLFLIPKAMYGMHQGNNYPAAYSVDEKALILEYSAKARQEYAPVIDRMGEPATIDMFDDGRFLSSTRSYRGKLCGSGYNFVRIEPDGTVIRCGSGKRLGNILLKNVSFLRAPKACDTVYCPYFCEKYTSPQFVQMQKGADTPFISSLSSLVKRVLEAC
jgi:MoaA/NifB/PqqE/SkfB family radical SAM enzyme